CPAWPHGRSRPTAPTPTTACACRAPGSNPATAMRSVCAASRRSRCGAEDAERVLNAATLAASTRRAVPYWPGWKRLPREARDTLFLLAVIAWTVLPHATHLP